MTRRYFSETVAKAPNGRPNFWEQVLDSAAAVVEIAELARLVTGKPRPIDMLAIGLKASHAATRLYKTWAIDKPVPDLSRFFLNADGTPREPWIPVPTTLGVCAFYSSQLSGEPQPGFINDPSGGEYAARIADLSDGLRLGWVGPPSTHPTHGQMWCAGESALAHIEKLASDTLWRAAGGRRALALSHEAFEPLTLPTDLIRTAFLDGFVKRVRAFWSQGVPRAYLLEGEPRVGKTTAARPRSSLSTPPRSTVTAVCQCTALHRTNLHKVKISA